MNRRRPKNPVSKTLALPAFTLLELMVVLVIIAIAAAIIIPQAVGTSDIRARSAARIVMSDLEYAQNHAIVTQADVVVTFDIPGNSYQVSNGSGALIHPITKQEYVVDFDTKTGLRDVSIVVVDFGGGSTVTFDALGAPSSDGTVDVAAGEHTYRVTVAPVTGRVGVAVLP